MLGWFKAIKQVSGYRKVEEEYEIGKEISRGKFGIVYEGFKAGSLQKCAIKVIKKDVIDQVELEQQQNEI